MTITQRVQTLTCDIHFGADTRPIVWWGGERVHLRGSIKRSHTAVVLAAGAVCRMQVWDEQAGVATTYVDHTGVVEGDAWSLELSPSETHLPAPPASSYRGVIRVFDADHGGGLTIWSGPLISHLQPDVAGVGYVGTSSPLILGQGVAAIAAGAHTVTVAELSLGATPSSVMAVVSRPTRHHFILLPVLDHDSLSATGFSFGLTARTDSAGYQLHWVAYP